MAMYSYRAINPLGKKARGMQDAANLIDLELHLKRSGLDLISARLVESNSSFGLKKIKRPDLITFFFTTGNASIFAIAASTFFSRVTWKSPCFLPGRKLMARI